MRRCENIASLPSAFVLCGPAAELRPESSCTKRARTAAEVSWARFRGPPSAASLPLLPYLQLLLRWGPLTLPQSLLKLLHCSCPDVFSPPLRCQPWATCVRSPPASPLRAGSAGVSAALCSPQGALGSPSSSPGLLPQKLPLFGTATAPLRGAPLFQGRSFVPLWVLCPHSEPAFEQGSPAWGSAYITACLRDSA